MAGVADHGNGFYCSTSGTVFTSKDDLAEHYRSDFHRYNLKRKVAGLPPVTREWFEARKAQLAQSEKEREDAAEQVWICPLTKKKFNSEQTYLAHLRSKKYRELLKRRGLDSAPEPIVQQGQRRQRQPNDTNDLTQVPAERTPSMHKAGYNLKPAVPTRNGHVAKDTTSRISGTAEPPADAEDAGSSSGWETASEEGEGPGSEIHWDPCQSLFDNHLSPSLEANLEYMYKRFGFFIPDAKYLADPEGLVSYLGLKLSEGRVPLYTRGDDPEAKQFQSLHAVQRHMVDTNQCRMAYDGNEEEYEEFYDYGPAEEQDGSPGPLAVAAPEDLQPAGGYELAVVGGGGGVKVLGSREFMHLYRQRPRPSDPRRSVQVGALVAQYRRLGIEDASSTPDRAEKLSQRRAERQQRRHEQRTFMRENVNRNLPRNVPY
uniref:Pre-60S factor REI1 n=1 Tax=Tetraselmis sp. GSL018 TaxID=582737 RepID=A0A061QV15_9CHLO|mmetsp:Transcript_23602/g.56409  ORF Transcript_23602/g.56409 Transcript_23602/m.56409 type:complete len:430 (-) Transcript_23602:129-1418(-)